MLRPTILEQRQMTAEYWEEECKRQQAEIERLRAAFSEIISKYGDYDIGDDAYQIAIEAVTPKSTTE